MTEKFVNIEVNDKVFFDSNIFVYSVDNDEPSKKSIAQKLLSNAAKNKKAIISTASKNGCVVCYSEDLNAGQIIEGVKVINPF